MTGHPTYHVKYDLIKISKISDYMDRRVTLDPPPPY